MTMRTETFTINVDVPDNAGFMADLMAKAAEIDGNTGNEPPKDGEYTLRQALTVLINYDGFESLPDGGCGWYVTTNEFS